jgi:hypothetical protein
VACRSDRHESGGEQASYPQRVAIAGSPVGSGCDQQPTPETTTMTDDSIALRELLEKSADADLLREMIGFAAERLMDQCRG